MQRTDRQEFANYVADLMQGIGPVYVKRMFGGHGVFLEGLMFGLISGNTLYLKADDETRPRFDELGLMPFQYRKKGKLMNLSYYQAPEEVMEQSEVMSEWANLAYGTALRAAARKGKVTGNPCGRGGGG